MRTARLEAKRHLRNQLYPGDWKLELVIHHVKYEEELRLIEQHGITVIHLDSIVEELATAKTIIRGASGSDLLELIMLGKT